MVHPRIKLFPGLSPAIYGRRAAAERPFPLSDPRCVLFGRGRDALRSGAVALGLSPGDEVLVPAYHCGSEIEALAGAGLRCRFYDAAPTLEPDADELAHLLRPRSRALLLIHYFGFPLDVARWRRWCDERELLLIEDCAHAWLASVGERPAGSFGDLAVFSFPKSFGVPGGGAAASAADATCQRLAASPAARTDGLRPQALAKRHISWLMTRSSAADRLLARFERPYEEDLSVGSPERPSRTTRSLLARLAYGEALQRRRMHYAALLEAAAPAVPQPFRDLEDGACPLIFPLAETAHAEAVAFFAERGIAAAPFWPQRHRLLPETGFPGADDWHRRFIALPVHQELTPDQLHRVRAALLERAER